MKEKLNVLFGLILIVVIGIGVFKLIEMIIEAFAKVNPTISAGIIAASATVIVSIISVLVAKRLEHKSLLAKEHRDKKTPSYEDMVKFIIRLVFADKLGLKPLTDQEMIEKMASFTENLVVWGSDEVVKSWVAFRMNSIANAGKTNSGILFEVEELLLAIRKDLGHSNKGLVKGKILSTFINDIDTLL